MAWEQSCPAWELSSELACGRSISIQERRFLRTGPANRLIGVLHDGAVKPVDLKRERRLGEWATKLMDCRGAS